MTDATRWRVLKRWWFWLIVAAAVLVLLGSCDWEGETFNVNLVNDTSERIQLQNCRSDDCDSFFSESLALAEPGESIGVTGTVGRPTWYQARDEEGNVLGCFTLDLDESANFDLYASDLRPCP